MVEQNPSLGLSSRELAMLRAVAAGRAQLSLSCEPDLFVDGLACCDQIAARRLARLNLVRPARPGRPGRRVPAKLTSAGYAAVESGKVAA
ncbi:hypothetical protein DL990_13535 [Amycolatopsis sp. WAC 01416]|uniref:hypothetical protein n=1 Tax=Amycolatopsis sp. WAC 01416 TaxID=2203196 RepID=UPI000F79DC11|nr:hypothetical protein [Amycolatopsis sp. WAC 01416]RSN34655.1 hypothetical protein DL990_13535 [Amycolatopsis sp. WAC 01416]